MFVPPDNTQMTEKYKIECGGICGMACLAVITRDSIQSVIENWGLIGLEFKGWTTYRQLRHYLQSKGFSVRQIQGTMFYNPRRFYIARVQWLGDGENKERPLFGWKHWAEATAHTHFIVIEDFRFFCNETGWDKFPKGLKEYLKWNDGVITSYLEIGPRPCANCGVRHIPSRKCELNSVKGMDYKPMEDDLNVKTK